MTRRAYSRFAGKRFPRPASLPCALCSGPATQDDFCMGCNKHVCEKCDHPDRPPQGTHDVSAHRQSPPKLGHFAGGNFGCKS